MIAKIIKNKKMDDPPVGQVRKNKLFVKLSMFISPALTGSSQ